MIRHLRTLVAIGVLSGLGACSSVPEPPEPLAATERTISQGQIVGFAADNAAQVWLGLPYAASTAGGESLARAAAGGPIHRAL